MLRRILPLVCSLSLCLAVSPAVPFEIIVAPAQDRVTPAPSPPADQEVQELPADTSGRLLEQFRRENPGFREHLFALVTDVYEDHAGNPGVRLERVLAGSAATLVELTGLPRLNNPCSAIINKQTLRLVQQERVAELVRAAGVAEVQDRRGGSALLLKPGETLYLWFGPIDDLQPFSLEHRLPGGETFAYFVGLDPRFLERYHRDFELATTPEQRYRFVTGYVANDPERKVWTVFARLMKDLRDLNTFEGYYQAYLIAQDRKDALMAQSLATTDEHRVKLEHIAVATLADKARLFEFDLQLRDGGTNTETGAGWLFSRRSHRAVKPLQGLLTVRMKKNSPVKVNFGRYRVTLAGTVQLPLWQKRVSSWAGDYDGTADLTLPVETTVEISAVNSSIATPVHFGDLLIAEYIEGTMGGYQAVWATGDPVVSLQIKNVELIQ